MGRHPPKRPRRMPGLPLQQTPTQIKFRRPCRNPPPQSSGLDPISTPLLTPGDVPRSRGACFTPLAQTPPAVPGEAIHPATPQQCPATPSPLPIAVHDSPPSRPSSSHWSGGLYSGHKPLTVESLYPTPPSTGSPVPLRVLNHDNGAVDARVRRLSFGADLENAALSNDRINASVGELSRLEGGKRTSEACVQRGVQNTRKRSLGEGYAEDTGTVEGSDENRGKFGKKAGEDVFRRECPHRDERDIAESVSSFPDTPDVIKRGEGDEAGGTRRDVRKPRELSGEAGLRTPEDTVVKRCQAPVWDGPITQIPETPIDQLPPREAPVYVVKTAVTAAGEVPSLSELPSPPLLASSSEGRKLGLLWMDIGQGNSRFGKDDNQVGDTRLVDESNSASTEPPSPIRMAKGEGEGNNFRDQLFCRSVRVSIPAGGFRSPSPDRTPSPPQVSE